MKSGYKIIISSIIFGLLVWFSDSVVDSLFFYEGSFLDLLILDVPKHEIYFRSEALIFFIIFGIITAWLYSKRKQAEKALQEAHDELQSAHDNLERQVQNRTVKLRSANELLNLEVEERIRNEKKMREQQEKLRSLSSKLLLTEDRERRRIATELHDGIGQTLAATKIKLGELREASTSNKAVKALDDITELIQQSIQDTRSLTFDLSPPVLHELGLEAALDWLVNQTRQKHDLQIEFNDDGQPKPLDNSGRVIMFQAARELIFNIVKHARAHSATVSVRKDNDAIRIDIEDDGLGFDVSKLAASGSRGFGLFNIRERINPLGGRMEIQSAPSGSTRASIMLPLAYYV